LMARHAVGIRREDKSRWERRVPLVPEDVERLEAEHEVEIIVQPSPIRVFEDADYAEVGARVDEDLSGAGVILANLRIDRDLHYLPRSLIDILEVPDGHFYMMGDNTQQSGDGRDWTAIEVAIDPEGRAVDPRTADPSYPRIHGNLRPREVGSPVDADENPVPVVARGRIGFTDHVGEVHSLKGEPSDRRAGKIWGQDGAWFKGPGKAEDGSAKLWSAPESKSRFVKREHILGRALLKFWPYSRIGFIRSSTRCPTSPVRRRTPSPSRSPPTPA